MRKLIVCIGVCLIFIPSLARAIDCFATPEDEIRMANELNRCRIVLDISKAQEEALKKAEERLAVQERILANDEQILKLKDGQIAAQETALKNYKSLVDLQTDSIEKLQKMSKPSMWERLQNMSLGAVIGAIIVGVLL